MAPVTEQEIYEVIKTLGPDELQHLFHNLGISQRDIDNEEKAADTTDPRLKARKVLLCWRQTRGREATLETLNIAKENAKQDTVTLEDIWAKRLKTKYVKDRSTIRFCRHWKAFADTDDIFVGLTLIEEKQSDRPSCETSVSESEDWETDSCETNASDSDNSCKTSESDDSQSMEILKKLYDLSQEEDNVKSTSQGEGIETNSYETSESESEEWETSSCNTKVLKSYQDFFQVLNNVHRILLQGPAGIGKTTLVSRLAFLWAKYDNESTDDSLNTSEKTLLNTFKLVLVLKMKHLRDKEKLETSIVSQLLPDVSEEQVARVLSRLGLKCLIVLDGYDEIPKDVEPYALESPFLSMCCIIVTTRPHLVDQFCQNNTRSTYAHVKVKGFSLRNSNKYIKKFFKHKEQAKVGDGLIDRIKEIPALKTLSSYPVLLVMLCILWLHPDIREYQFYSLTILFDKAVQNFNKPYEKQSELPPDVLHNLLLKVGKPALEAMFINTVQLSSTIIDEKTRTDSFRIGLLVEEEGDYNAFVTFIHKTFQEFCAGKYLAYLFESNNEQFQLQLKNINSNNIFDMEYLLQFCCGLSTRASRVILHHVIGFLIPIKHTDTDWYSLPLLMLYETEIYNSHWFNKERINFHDELVPLFAINPTEEIELSNMTVIAFSYLALSCQQRSYVWLNYIKRVRFIYCTLNVNTMVKLVSYMPAVISVQIESVTFEGEIDENISVSCKSVTKFSLVDTSVSLNTIIRLLGYMPAVTLLELGSVTFESIIGECVSIPVSCKSITEFTLGEIPSPATEFEILKALCNSPQPKVMSVNTIMKLLGCMPSVKMITFTYMNVEGEIDEKIPVSCELLTEVSLCSISVSINTMMKLLSCFPAVTLVKLVDVTLEGEVDENASASCRSLNKLTITGSSFMVVRSVNANTVMRLLGCMPSLKSLTFDLMTLEGEIDVHVFVICISLIEFNLLSKASSVTLTANTLMRLLGCMPSVKSVTLVNVTVLGEIDKYYIPICCRSLNYLNLKKTFLSRDILKRLIECMPLEAMVEFTDVHIPCVSCGRYQDKTGDKTVWSGTASTLLTTLSSASVSRNCYVCIKHWRRKARAIKKKEGKIRGRKNKKEDVKNKE